MVKRFLKQAWTAIANPGQEERVQAIARAIRAEFRQNFAGFNLERVLAAMECAPKDVQIATGRVHQQVVERYWAKGLPTAKQTDAAKIVASRLRILPAEHQRLWRSAAEQAFAAALRDTLADGRLDPDEIERLTAIAASADQSLPDFVAASFHHSGLQLLSEVLRDAVATGTLSAPIWTNLLSSLANLGIPRQAIQPSVLQLVPQFAERVLADAKSTESISGAQVNYLNWLCSEFELPPDTQRYVSQEIDMLQRLMAIRQGNLTPLEKPASVNFTPGEILYFAGNASLIYQRRRQGELVPFRSDGGVFWMTDNRVIFQSPEKPMTFKLSGVISISGNDSSIYCELSGKPAVWFQFTSPALLTWPTINTVFQLHKQTLVRNTGDQAPTRHISREVRQRVWQTYEGRCVECGDRNYLEYDHIIPVAKGGSNDEKNIQLLCRMCNLKKRDNI